MYNWQQIYPTSKLLFLNNDQHQHTTGFIQRLINITLLLLINVIVRQKFCLWQCTCLFSGGRFMRKLSCQTAEWYWPSNRLCNRLSNSLFYEARLFLSSSQRHTLPIWDCMRLTSEVIILNNDQHQHQKIISTNNRINWRIRRQHTTVVNRFYGLR